MQHRVEIKERIVAEIIHSVVVHRPGFDKGWISTMDFS
jgi:hypothetical protein